MIDGTHVKIDPPKLNPDDYIDRKNNHSIQAQCVCNEKTEIIDFFCGFAGSVHDSRAFRVSNIGQNIENICSDGKKIIKE